MNVGAAASRTRTRVHGVVALVAAFGVISGAGVALGSRPLLLDRFSEPDGLLSNEYAFYHPGARAPRSARWDVTSGSAFIRNKALWTGIPDDRGPNASSSSGTHSAVLRMVSKRSDLLDVDTSFDLVVQRFVHTISASAPPLWSGVHVLLRYQNEYSLYAVSVNRRDNVVVIKKKVPGGPSNGGTYYTLARGRHAAPLSRWQHISARVRNMRDGSVQLELNASGQLILRAVDAGLGGPPIREAGRVAIRGDNCEFRLDNFVVRGI